MASDKPPLTAAEFAAIGERVQRYNAMVELPTLMSEDRARLHAALEESYRRCRELEAEVEKRICGTCMERHPFGVMCPPFEVRRTGQQWFRDRVHELEAEVARLRELLRKANEPIGWGDHLT